jgi:hypothetical protein
LFKPNQKSHKWYLFYRFFIAITLIGMLVWGVSWIADSIASRAPSVVQLIGLGILIPCFMIAAFMLMSLIVFPFKFSILGNLERTPFPNEQPVLRKTGTWGRIGLFRATIPFFNWILFPSGLGISIPGIGKVFIPINRLHLNKTSKSFSNNYQIIHDSPEVHGPIYLPDEILLERLRVLAGKNNTHVINRVKQRNNKQPKPSYYFWGMLLIGIIFTLFFFYPVFDRLNIDIQGIVLSRQEGHYDTIYRTYTDYRIQQDDGKIIIYRGNFAGASLSEDIPIGAEINKKKWEINYAVNDKKIKDFTLDFYLIFGFGGFALFVIGLIGIIRRWIRTTK